MNGAPGDPEAREEITPATGPAVVTGAATALDRPHRLRMVIQVGLSLAVLAMILFVVIPKYVDLQEVADALTGLSGEEWAALAGVAVFYIFAGAPLIAVTSPGLGLGRSFMTYQITTAVARLLPGGGAFAPAIRYRLMRGWGFQPEFIAASLLSMGALNAAMWLLLPVVAVLAASLAGQGGWRLAVVAILASAVLAVAGTGVWWAMRDLQSAGSIGRAIGSMDARVRRRAREEQRRRWSDRLIQLRAQLMIVLAHREVPVIAAAPLPSIAGYIVLLVALRVVGVSQHDISWEWVLVGYSVGNILGAIPITPSGLGIADLGVASVLSVGQTAETQALIVAALVLYRVVTFLTPIFTGGVCFLLARRSLAHVAGGVPGEDSKRDQDAATGLKPVG